MKLAETPKPNKAGIRNLGSQLDTRRQLKAHHKCGEIEGTAQALVREAGRLHVVAGSVCQAPSREKREAFRFLQHHLQLLKVLQPSHVFVLGRKEMWSYSELTRCSSFSN